MTMTFKRVSPPAVLHDVVECFWIVEDDDRVPVVQKIIPDGFTEIIFHYRDPYRINLHGSWETQSTQLFCGQITKHFSLENTGASGMLGIKFRPTALASLFNISMHAYTDRAIPLAPVVGDVFSSLHDVMNTGISHDSMINTACEILSGLTDRIDHRGTNASIGVNMIHEQHGMLSVADICETLNTSERNLERSFRQYVGLSPKFYCRLIRFARIFQLIREHREEGAPWSDLVHKLGYYDQPHFIRNFKAFTGDEPSSYFFDHPTLANFFLVR